MKKCIVCSIEKPLEDFYKHSQMKDGHVNKCIECSKKQSDDRYKKLMEDPSFVEKERSRGKEKSKSRPRKTERRTGIRKAGNQIYLDHRQKYPEKYIVANMLKHHPKKSTHHLHHWSYNVEHFDSCIELTPEEHKKAHRFIIYDQERYMYRRIDTMELLDSKESHELYIRKCIKDVPF
jgi:hypothetical protein